MNPTTDEIKQARLEAGLTQTQAGETVYVTRSTWAKWESGENVMSPAYWELFQLKTKKVFTSQ